MVQERNSVFSLVLPWSTARKANSFRAFLLSTETSYQSPFQLKKPLYFH